MRRRIPETEWQKFFEKLNKLCAGWKTTVEDRSGKCHPRLEKLSLAALVFMKQNGQTLIELIVGDSLINHRTYLIFDPRKIVFDEDENLSILIKDSRAVKTSILLTQADL